MLAAAGAPLVRGRAGEEGVLLATVLGVPTAGGKKRALQADRARGLIVLHRVDRLSVEGCLLPLRRSEPPGVMRGARGGPDRRWYRLERQMQVVGGHGVDEVVGVHTSLLMNHAMRGVTSEGVTPTPITCSSGLLVSSRAKRSIQDIALLAVWLRRSALARPWE
ncbi:MAG TPA: hypothetical protein VFA46_13130 [Actinomycetes bacterium]|nr:hypothetical protein [Actinomycetes bacterium]